jgi:exopolyphosphatase/guanosine-5'-triphosphate,3'-diphosphate pyrophosphatase
VILNLGAEVASSGRVPDDLLDRALHTVARFRDIAERSGAEAIWPVATSAFRDAANQPWLSKALRGALGVPVRILGGDEEVQCTVSGIRASVALPDEPWVAFDLGGGSLRSRSCRARRSNGRARSPWAPRDSPARWWSTIR